MYQPHGQQGALTVNDPAVFKVEEASAQNFSSSDGDSCDESEDEGVFIGEMVRYNRPITRSTSQEPIEMDAPAKAATRPASHNAVSSFMHHIEHQVALAEVLDKTCVKVVNLDDQHNENSNSIDLGVVREDQSVETSEGDETSADSLKSVNETQHTAESILTSADHTYKDQLIQSYLDKEPEIEAVKALYCRVCREYFAFEENAVHIHRQSARHLKGTSAGNSSEWRELQANSACESSTPSATTESAASALTVSSAPTSLLQPATTDTFSLTTTGDPSRENSASSGIQFDVAGTNPAPVSITKMPALVPIVPPLMSAHQKPKMKISPPEIDNQAPPPSNSKSVLVTSRTEEPSFGGKAVVTKPAMPITSSTLIPATVSVRPGSSGDVEFPNFVVEPYEELKKESEMLELIIKRIRAGVKVMVVLRGIPGSGKSHLANRLKGLGIVVSYDDYLTDFHGNYIWNEESAVRAASMALKEVLAVAKSGRKLIIVDGHNLLGKETSPFQKIAKSYKYKFYTVEPNTPWKYDIEICARKNVHGLTFDQVSKIAGRYVDRMMKLANKKKIVVDPEEPKSENQLLETTVSVLPGSSGGGTDAHTTKPSTHSKFDIQNLVAYEELQKENILLKEVIKSIQAGKKVMVVLRGIPGSGKSHLANRLKGQGIVVSHDRYLTDLHGKYILNEESVVFAISMARKEVLAATKSGRQLVIIDGHNLEDFEISHYLHLAKASKYRFYTVEPNTPWKYDIEICTQKNVHGLIFDQVSKIAGLFVARRRKKANKQAKKATIEQQAQDQAAVSGQEPPNKKIRR